MLNFVNFSDHKLSNWSKILSFILLLIFLVSLVTYKLPLPAALDLPRQMINGRDFLQGDFYFLTHNTYSYTQTDHYFATHHWLYGVGAYLMHSAIGWNGMVIFKVLFILLTFGILFRAALFKADFWLVTIASIPSIFIIAGRSDLRPELFGFFFIAMYIYLLLKLEKRPESKLIFWTIPIQILWANLHITFPIGIMLISGFLLETIILHRKNLKQNLIVKKLILLLVILTVVSFINPLGIKGVIYSLTANIGSDSLVKSSEVQPIASTIDDVPRNASIPLALVIPLIIATAVSFVIGFKKKNIFYFLAFVGSSIMAYFVIRSGPFLAIFFLLAFPANLSGLFVRAKQWAMNKWPITKISFENAFGLLMSIVLVYFMGSNYTKFTFDREVGIGLARDAESSARFFIEQDLEGPIFNDTDSGSYLTYYLYPREKVYADNRFGDAYSQDFFQKDYVAAVTDDTKWREIVDKYKINTIFMYQYDQGYNMRDFLFRRINDPDWSWVYGDRFNIILVRNIPENQDIIDKFHITTENAQERFSHLTYSLDANDQVAVADLFALMGQSGWALSHYAIAVSQHPEWAKIWFVMGKMELQRADQKNSNPALALMYLEQAIVGGWKTTNSYSFLALAYYRLGQMDKAKEAVAEELKINPNSDDAKQWLNNFIEYDAEHLKQ